jgi:hypothetical protein
MRLWGRNALALIAVIGVVACAVGVIWRIRFSRDPVDAATVYAGYLAGVAVAVTLLLALGAWWWKGTHGAGVQVTASSQVAAAADRLAEVMADRWRREAAGRRIVTPAPATVRWRWAGDVAAPRPEVTMRPARGTGPPPLPDLGSPGELLGSGVVIRLHDEVYARLPHGRLVLLGGPGAGKTGAMILLLLAALDCRAGLASDERGRIPVPVWLTLGGWNPAATTLLDWVTATMNRDFPVLRASVYGRDAAGELLRSGRVALFLDGLDEMPAGARADAFSRVEEEARGLRIVVTSRPEEYGRALPLSQQGHTAVIELRPVRPQAAAAYLLHGQAGRSRRQWEELGAYLIHHPDSIAALALDNPLNLSLARDAYASLNPAALTDADRFATVEAIREHLIDQFLVTAYPDEHQRAHATQWLAWIARQMGTSQDLPWWDIPGWIPRRRLRLARGLATGTVIGVAVALTTGFAEGLSQGPAIGIVGALSTGIFGGFPAGFLAGLMSRLTPQRKEPKQPLALRRKFSPRVLKFFLPAMLLLGLWAGLVSGPAEGIIMAADTGIFLVLLNWLASKFRFGLAGAPKALVPRWPRRADIDGLLPFSLIFFPLLVPMFLNLWATPIAQTSSATAAGVYHADRRTCIIYGLVYGIAIGLITGLWAGLVAGLRTGSGAGIENGLVFGLPTAFGIGLAAWLSAGQVPLVNLTEIALRRLPDRVHFLPLLEDALGRQVLRQAGTVYQFRHAALQTRLAASYAQPGTPLRARCQKSA